jgi:hypothetical protein
MKAMLLLMVSSGVRIGALPDIKMQDMKALDHPAKIYQIYIYPGTRDEYFTYCSPEARRFIDEYLDYRKREGEEVKATSPLFRDMFDKFNVKKPKPLAKFTIAANLRNLALKAGIREASKDRHKRKEVMLAHGFRKFFFRALGKSNVDAVVREFLMGHKSGNTAMGVTNLMMVYDATEDNDALKGYLKAVDNLTVFTENKLAMEVEDLNRKLSGEEKLREEMAELRESQRQLAAMLKIERAISEKKIPNNVPAFIDRDGEVKPFTPDQEMLDKLRELYNKNKGNITNIDDDLNRILFGKSKEKKD